ncbi:putative ribonuclease H-like domain-containing protein [Tanacetum coccineum]
MVVVSVVIMVVVLAATAAVGGGAGFRRVAESGSGDRVDRVTRNTFGLGRKTPPEKFSGGGEWWPAAGEGICTEIFEGKRVCNALVCVVIIDEMNLSKSKVTGNIFLYVDELLRAEKLMFVQYWQMEVSTAGVELVLPVTSWCIKEILSYDVRRVYIGFHALASRLNPSNRLILKSRFCILFSIHKVSTKVVLDLSKEEMDLETAQTNTTAKLPLLKQGEYDMWKLRIKQYFQVQDYALWDVIENGNSFKPTTQTTTNADGFRRLNKPNLDTMSFDDLYNNFKIVKHEVKGTASSSSQNVAFVSSSSSTNEVNTTYEVSTANTQVSPASTQVSTASTHTKLGRKDTINGIDTAGYDKSKTINMEETSSKAMLAIVELVLDWSYMAELKSLPNMLYGSFQISEIEFNKSEFNLATYKRGLASVEEQLVFYKKNELEKLKQEKESNQLKIEKFDNASKSLDKLIGSQIPDKSRKGLGFVNYNAVTPPPTGLFLPPNLDLSNSSLEEFQQPEFEGYGPKTSKSVSEDTSNEVRESPDASLVEELMSNDKLEKKTVFPTVAKINFVRPQQQEKPVRKPIKYAEMYRSQTSRGNQRNWNNQKSQQLGSDFVMYNKACFVCGSFNHVQANCNYHQRDMMVSGNNYTRVNYNYSAKKAYPSAHRNIVLRAVLMKISLRPLNTARPVNITHPKTIVYSVTPMLMLLRPQHDGFGDLSNLTMQQLLSRDIIMLMHEAYPRNMSYLSDFKEFDGGYVAFGGGAKRGRITGKGTLKIGKLGFKDVYFVKELQFNLFSVSQMCDKKNNVLFTDTRCFVLSPDLKLADESQVLLKVPRKNNMYNVDMKNIVPKESLTCLVVNATLDESMLWDRRLGHVNFKTINKLVKDKLMKGLPIKHFENDQTYVACLKGKQHKASFVTDDYSRFTWVFFLASKDKISGILKSFITQIENLVDKKVKIIRCDNGTKFKNRVMSEFYEKKGIKREFSVARTPQQNGVAERRNRTLIKAARTMLADSKLPTTFWVEAVNTACYV